MRPTAWLIVGLLMMSGTGAVRAEEGTVDGGDHVVVTADGDDGFTIRSTDGSFRLNLTGYAQGDARFYNESSGGIDTFLTRQVRPMLTGTVSKYFDFNITPDFGGGQTVLEDAFVDARFASFFKVKVGKFKPPVGLERLQFDPTLPFNERALPTDIVPNRDIGLEIHGQTSRGIVTYEVGFFNGGPDDGQTDGDTNDAKDVAARLFFQPFVTSSVPALKALGVGVAGTAGSEQGAANLSAYKTVGQLTFFTFGTNVVADGSREHLTPQLWYQAGSFRLLGEYVVERQDLKQTTSGRSLAADSSAWQATAAFVLTGEEPVGGFVKPRNPFDPKKGNWGAVEIAARYSSLAVDSAVFTDGFADITKSARTASEWGLAASWYLTRWVKFVGTFDRTTFVGGLPNGGNRNAENSIILRTQVGF